MRSNTKVYQRILKIRKIFFISLKICNNILFSGVPRLLLLKDFHPFSFLWLLEFNIIIMLARSFHMENGAVYTNALPAKQIVFIQIEMEIEMPFLVQTEMNFLVIFYLRICLLLSFLPMVNMKILSVYLMSALITSNTAQKTILILQMLIVIKKWPVNYFLNFIHRIICKSSRAHIISHLLKTRVHWHLFFLHSKFKQ